MTFNIHPIIVHFPIALLFVYSVIKILPFGKYFPNVAWKHIERALLVFGVAGAFASLATGETAEHLANPNHQLVETHSALANISTWLYGALLAGEILLVAHDYILLKVKNSSLLKLSDFLEKLLTHQVFSKVLAFLGFVAISLTGMLGGIMVYGISADPLAPIVLSLFGITL